jgi:hypothetical protein
MNTGSTLGAQKLAAAIMGMQHTASLLDAGGGGGRETILDWGGGGGGGGGRETILDQSNDAIDTVLDSGLGNKATIAGLLGATGLGYLLSRALQKKASAIMGMDQQMTGGAPGVGGIEMQQMQGQIPGQQQQQQNPEVDQAVRQKMQYKWRDKVQKIEQGKQKLELERDQADAEMQLEEKQMKETEGLKHEQKQFDQQQKVQQQMAKAQAAMPQFPMGQQAQAQSPAVAQQQPGLAAQQQPQPQVQKMAAGKGPGFWDNVKTTLDDDAYFAALGQKNPLKEKASREKYLADNPAVLASAMSGPIGLIVYRSQQLARHRNKMAGVK